MDKNYRIVEAEDWSKIIGLDFDDNLFCYADSDDISSVNLGIILDNNNNYRTTGFVGVTLLIDREKNIYRNTDGQMILLVVKPRFDINIWDMLIEVMHDDEYDSYIIGCGEPFFSIESYSIPVNVPIKKFGGDILLAISYIRNCYKLCSGELKKSIVFKKENIQGKIKGKIDFTRHISKNISCGRLDRVYCQYPTFSQDIALNRILKSALQKAYIILNKKDCFKNKQFEKIREFYMYCMKTLRFVREKESISVLRKLHISGFDSKYKSSIELAKLIFQNDVLDISEKKSDNKNEVVFYSMKMEMLFEFYVRSKIKKYIKSKSWDDFLRLSKYEPKGKLTVADNKESYLMPTYIPDLAFQWYDCMDEKWKYIAVFDVKYQFSDSFKLNTRRHNTHQLLFYMLMLNVRKCGFIFPVIANCKSVYTSLNIQNSNMSKFPREYAQYYIGNEEYDNDVISQIVAFITKNTINYLHKDGV